MKKLLLILPILILFTSCKSYLKVSRLETGKCFENIILNDETSIPWLEYQLTNRGYKDIKIKHSGYCPYKNSDKDFTITDLNGNNILIKQNPDGFEMNVVEVSYKTNDETKTKTLLIIKNKAEILHHVASQINGNEISVYVNPNPHLPKYFYLN